MPKTQWLHYGGNPLAPIRRKRTGSYVPKDDKSSSRLASQLRLVAVNVGRTETALGAFYRRLAARIGKAKAVTATARKLAILFYRAMRFGMQYQDSGVDQYEQRYRERVVKQLERRAARFGLTLRPVAEGVS